MCVVFVCVRAQCACVGECVRVCVRAWVNAFVYARLPVCVHARACVRAAQGLLKVAVDNARAQEKHVQQERKEMKMELYREREMREGLERQLTSELHSRGQGQGVCGPFPLHIFRMSVF